jgi:ribosome-associated protein
MNTPESTARRFQLRGEHITLEALLKAAGLALAGVPARQPIAAGEVRVDGAVETRRGAKIRAGQRVELAGDSVELVADPSPDRAA